MKVLTTTPLYEARKGDRTFLTMHSRTFEHKGRTSEYFMVTRGTEIVPHAQKCPDAVVVVATLMKDGEKHLVMTSEFRVPLGIRELGFVAGLIDTADYNGGATHREAAIVAAIREMREETGLDLKVTDVSPANLYSSAGLTNESVTFVFGEASGEISDANLEAGEDIQTVLISQSEASNICRAESDEYGHSKTAWPFLWAFARNAL